MILNLNQLFLATLDTNANQLIVVLLNIEASLLLLETFLVICVSSVLLYAMKSVSKNTFVSGFKKPS